MLSNNIFAFASPVFISLTLSEATRSLTSFVTESMSSVKSDTTVAVSLNETTAT